MPDDYKKKNLPFVFDADHSRSPIDGRELQIQNMTVMPNFRLSEADARDIESVSVVMTWPVLHEVLQGRRLAAELEDGVGHLYTGYLGACADVVYGSWLPLLQDMGDRADVIFAAPEEISPLISSKC